MKTVVCDEFRDLSVVGWLSWAYRVELPKLDASWEPGGNRPRPAGFGNGFSAVSRYGELLAHVSGNAAVNWYGVVPDFTAQDGPDDRALAIGDAVDGLATMDIIMPEGWQPTMVWRTGDVGAAADLTMFGADLAADVLARAWAMTLGRNLAMLVKGFALTGRWPSNRIEVCRMVAQTINGRPAWFVRSQLPVQRLDGGVTMRDVEVDGYNYRQRRPRAGAYQKMRLVPDPARDVAEAIERDSLLLALVSLAEQVAVIVGDAAVPSSMQRVNRVLASVN